MAILMSALRDKTGATVSKTNLPKLVPGSIPTNRYEDNCPEQFANNLLNEIQA